MTGWDWIYGILNRRPRSKKGWAPGSGAINGRVSGGIYGRICLQLILKSGKITDDSVEAVLWSGMVIFCVTEMVVKTLNRKHRQEEGMRH